MAAEADIEVDGAKKSSKMPLILGLLLAVAGGGGGYFAVNSGLLGGGDSLPATQASGPEQASIDYNEAELNQPLKSLAFVPLDPFVVSLRDGSTNALLRFTAQLEVADGASAEVEAIKPRIMDVLNGYLRAVDLEDLASATALDRLRGQMLRRVQVVAGAGNVKDLLIIEFVLN